MKSCKVDFGEQPTASSVELTFSGRKRVGWWPEKSTNDDWSPAAELAPHEPTTVMGSEAACRDPRTVKNSWWMALWREFSMVIAIERQWKPLPRAYDILHSLSHFIFLPRAYPDVINRKILDEKRSENHRISVLFYQGLVRNVREYSAGNFQDNYQSRPRIPDTDLTYTVYIPPPQSGFLVRFYVI